jgi:hypothetical protein
MLLRRSACIRLVHDLHVYKDNNMHMGSATRRVRDPRSGNIEADSLQYPRIFVRPAAQMLDDQLFLFCLYLILTINIFGAGLGAVRKLR